jgi:hypothetical protein
LVSVYDRASQDTREKRVVTDHSDALNAHEFSFESRFAVFKEHGNHFAQIGMKFIQRSRLRLSARKTGHVPHEQSRVGVTLYHGREILHAGFIHGFNACARD